MSIFDRSSSGHLSSEEIQQLAGTTRMVEEPLPKHRPAYSPETLAPHLWQFITDLSIAFGGAELSPWSVLSETARHLWQSAVAGIAQKYWEEQPIQLWQEAESAFNLQNQLGGAFAITWKDAPASLRWAYWGAILLLTRLADYDSGDDADMLAETEACREWVLSQFVKEVTNGR